MSMRNMLKSERPRVAVIGSGVIGAGTALALLRKAPNCILTIYSDKQTPNTTGDGSAGLWYPYITGGTFEKDIKKWSKITWDLLESWYKSGDPGIVSCPFIMISDEELPTPEWYQIPSGFRRLSRQELSKYGQRHSDGYTYGTYLAEPFVFLPYLNRAIETLGGKFVKRFIKNLDELYTEADVIINCSGLGARDLVGDKSVYPVRGQVHRIDAPWVTSCLADGSKDAECYILPNSKSVVLGGTHQEGDYRTEVDQKDKDAILEKCMKLCPSLKRGRIVKDWVGLRPVRSRGVRLEMEENVGGRNIPRIIHNYGHGGSGVTLFWGCAQEASDLAIEAINAMISPLAKL